MKQISSHLMERYHQLCPAALGFSWLAIDAESTFVPIQTDRESFIRCLKAKAGPAMAACGTGSRPKCTSDCEAALEDLAPKLDGSCCSEAPANARSQCVAYMKQISSHLMERYHQLCPAAFGFSWLAVDAESTFVPIQTDRESFIRCLKAKAGP